MAQGHVQKSRNHENEGFEGSPITKSKSHKFKKKQNNPTELLAISFHKFTIQLTIILRVSRSWNRKVTNPKWSRIIQRSFWATLVFKFTIKMAPKPPPNHKSGIVPSSPIEPLQIPYYCARTPFGLAYGLKNWSAGWPACIPGCTLGAATLLIDDRITLIDNQSIGDTGKFWFWGLGVSGEPFWL